MDPNTFFWLFAFFCIVYQPLRDAWHWLCRRLKRQHWLYFSPSGLTTKIQRTPYLKLDRGEAVKVRYIGTEFQFVGASFAQFNTSGIKNDEVTYASLSPFGWIAKKQKFYDWKNQPTWLEDVG